MDLVIKVTTPPPSKKEWIEPDPETRRNWTSIFETIVNWFCLSNSIRTNHNLDIRFPDFTIRFEGKKLRYLAPPFRSVASLVFKAYNIATTHLGKYPIKSTPGITIISNPQIESYEQPRYCIELNKSNTDYKITTGTIFTFHVEDAISIEVNHNFLSFAIISILEW
ncbi:MAG: hypothetical protein OEZ01_04035 [Candidatus Heimdallarchaeota archaeon]|nr:hypothetical protein [Candidatus Heimdallarchaeota archaeon]MDH5645149.1 hypothetical protein [Candidatus Heimdallarchaeota archaeon]